MILIAAGGLKVRFIDSSIKLPKSLNPQNTMNDNFGSNGFSNMGMESDELGMAAITANLLSGRKPSTMQIAELYVSKHNQMKQVSIWSPNRPRCGLHLTHLHNFGFW